MSKDKLTHVGDHGKAQMVNIGEKSITMRRAVASARVLVSETLLHRLRENSLAKGDALAVARIAGIQAAKRTDELIPLCHSLPLLSVSVELELCDKPPSVLITTEARAEYETGVEMEALTAASIAALAIYDMGKAVDRGIVIDWVRLERKEGGKSGVWERKT